MAGLICILTSLFSENDSFVILYKNNAKYLGFLIKIIVVSMKLQ
ncbi:MAG: hypothetical protein PWQ17_745 [Anaerophaga sp.]|nr:hypothetical protein [Anaerophaga sp.]